MRKLFKFIKGNYILAIAAPLFMLVEVAMDLMQPTLMSNIIDIGVANGDIEYILATGGRMLIYALIGVLGGFACIVTSSYAAVGFSSRLRQAVFNKVQTFSYVELDKFKTASLITRLTNDVTQVQHIVVMSLRMMVRAPLMSIGGIVMAIRLSPALSWVLLIAIPLMLVGAALLIKRTMPMFMTMQDKVDRVNTVMRENLLGVKVIKSFVNQKKEQNRFGVENKDLMDWSVRALQNMILMFPLVNLVMNLSVVAVLWFGGRMAIMGTLEIGKIMAFINYLIQIMSSVMMVVMVSMHFSRAKVSAQRLNDVLDTETSIHDPEEVIDVPQNYDIEFIDVSYRHHNSGEWVLKDINLKINEGESIGIIGATGSGKSTLVSLIPRLYDVTKGKILVGGTDVRNMPLNELRNKIGMVLQESIIFANTIEENLRFGKQNATSEELDLATNDAQALEFIQEKTEGFSTWVEQRGRNFSGGQKQRLSIARTLLRNPQILILDDSTSAVDMITEAKIHDAINRRLDHCTLILIAQRIAAIKDADKILVLDEGKMSAFGPHKELLSENDIYRYIAISQLGEEVLNDVS